MSKILSGQFVISGLSLPFTCEDDEFLNIAKERMKRVGVSPDRLHFQVYKMSVDARKKNDIRRAASVLVTSENEIGVDEGKAEKISLRAFDGGKPIVVRLGSEDMKGRPLVVGMGPCGMFCALLLARNGYAPILVDRGGNVDERVAAVETFYRSAVLDTDTNIQFGAGGAGTFSDGKLVTRIHDPLCRFVLETFRDFGAPEDVLTKAKPHVGTDILRTVVDNILAEIKRLGGELIYHCRVEDFTRKPDGGFSVRTTAGEISCGSIILAVGHSARDTYRVLGNKSFSLVPKPFSVGVRIEHLQRDLDESLFGDKAGHPKLGKGEYTLSDTRSSRGVYTFCMCPGGQVVAAASQEGGIVVNGMSANARDGKNANAAIAVSVLPGDVGDDVFKAIAFQRELEKAAFAAGGKTYAAPCQTVGDFLAGKSGTPYSKVVPTYKDGDVVMTDLRQILPGFVNDGLAAGLSDFSKKISCFRDPAAVLTGVETRTSAPLRILRGEDGCAVGFDKIYPGGEGAGYAGGITSAAVDGLRIALSVMARFAPDHI